MPNAPQAYDAIVVGSGISGDWAAKELTEKCLKLLLLERGRNIEHIAGYTTALKAPSEVPGSNGGGVPYKPSDRIWCS